VLLRRAGRVSCGFGAFESGAALPAPLVSSAPLRPTISTRATVSFDRASGMTYECSLDRSEFLPCPSPVTFGGLHRSRHVFGVRARNSTGVTSDASTYSWTVVQPRLRHTQAYLPLRPLLTTAPVRPWMSRNATFAWLLQRSATAECRLDAGIWKPCPNPKGYLGLRLGTHVFRVRAKHANGRRSGVNRFVWKIVSSAPPTHPTITSGPDEDTTSTDAVFAFDVAAGSSFRCRLDGSGWQQCSNPAVYVGLGTGPHTFCVRAILPGGVAGLETCVTWTVHRPASPPQPSWTAATPTASLVGRDATVSWAQSIVVGSPLGQLAGGSYTVTRYAESAPTTPIAVGGSCAGTVSGASDPISCTEPSLPTGRWRYTATPTLDSLVGSASAQSASLVIAPDAPISLALTNGGGTGNAYINATNEASLTFDVMLPSTSLASDAVTLSLTGGSTTVTATAAGITGGGTRTFTAIDASGLADGSIAVSSSAASSYGDSSSSTSITPTKDTVAPTLLTLTMQDNNTNGKVDRALATFSEALSAYSAGTTPWTLTNVPSGGSLSSVTRSGATATLTISEGAGIRDAAGNQSSFTATTPNDNAKPVPVSVTSANNGLTAGLMEVGDTFLVTFSEPIATPVGPSTTITETDPSGAGNDRLTIGGLTAVAGLATGSNAYILTDNTSASFSSSTISTSGAIITATVAGTCSGTCGVNITAGIGALVFTPDPTLQDAAGNAAAGSLTTPGTFRLF
jgi:hypothetical protein